MKDFPRRNQLDKCTPAELAIYKAMEEVEKAGASAGLTGAIIKLQEAKELVADFVDGVTAVVSQVTAVNKFKICPPSLSMADIVIEGDCISAPMQNGEWVIINKGEVVALIPKGSLVFDVSKAVENMQK